MITPEEKQRQMQEQEIYRQQVEQEIMAAQQMQQSQQASPYSSAMFAGQNKQNLVEWQLDFRPELEDIERLLRCDVLTRDAQGNENWITNPNKEFILFNSLGVSDIIREIRMFLNKNKVLSNYSLEEIKPRVCMLGHELRSLIYNNYEYYGLDNEYKMNNYPIVILTLLSMIEDAYRRAINGEERRDLNSARVVNQNEAMMPQGMMNYPQVMGSNQGKKRSWLNPFSWGR